MSERRGSKRVFQVEVADEGKRLDVYLTERCPDLSRSRVKNELDGRGQVTVDARPRPASFRVRAGQRIAFQTAVREPLDALPQDIPLDVIWEDENLVVINKAVGMVVHPAVGHPDGTLVNALLHRYGSFAAGDDPLRPGIVHRLDRDTSGLLVVALNEIAHRQLAAQLRDRSMGRAYLAVSWGRWTADGGSLEGQIGRHAVHRQRMAVVAAGRTALTRYSVLEDYHFAQLCRVELGTGRTHQIRVHFAHAGHPVVGDILYGDDARARGVHGLDRRAAEAMVRMAGRQLLHAADLRFRHPTSGAAMSFSVPPPPDFAAVLAALRGAAPGTPGHDPCTG